MSCDVPNSDGQSTCTAKSKFSIAPMLILTAIWALLLQLQSWQSMIVVSVLLLTWLFGCPRTRTAVQLVVPALYIPGGLICVYFLIASGSHWELIRHTALLPGAIPVTLIRLGSDLSTSLLAAAIFGSIIFLMAVSVIRFYAFTRDGVITAAALFSLWSGYVSAHWM